jgi:hypothetical protein
MDDKVEIVIVLERYKTRTITKAWPDCESPTFVISSKLYEAYITAQKKLKDLEDTLIEQARSQGAYAPLKDKKIYVSRYHERINYEKNKIEDDGEYLKQYGPDRDYQQNLRKINEGEVHKFSDSGEVTIKPNGL